MTDIRQIQFKFTPALIEAGAEGIDRYASQYDWPGELIDDASPLLSQRLREEIAQAVLSECFSTQQIVTQRRLDEVKVQLVDARTTIQALKRRLRGAK